MTDDVEKTAEPTAAQLRMAKARAARQAKLAEKAAAPAAAAPAAEPVTRQAKNEMFPDTAATRTQTRAPARSATPGRAQVLGRDGEVLSRTHTQVGDQFDIPAHLRDKDWDMQWIPVDVLGDKDVVARQQHTMHQNGWRPVPSERYAGTLVPNGSTGPLIREKMLLVERPMVLSIEARNEDIRNARQLISDQNEALKIASVGKGMGTGFEMRNQISGIKVQIDKSLDVLNVNQEAGNYKLAE